MQKHSILRAVAYILKNELFSAAVKLLTVENFVPDLSNDDRHIQICFQMLKQGGVITFMADLHTNLEGEYMDSAVNLAPCLIR